MQAIFDVGANNGSWGLDAAQRFPAYQVFAFEPTPALCAGIRARATELGLTNYHLIEAAIADLAGTVKFNVAGQADWGCSSLLAFNEGLEQTWPGRTDFQVTEVIEVPCIRLDSVVEQHGITRIDFLHCDTQGTDLKVLASLGNQLRLVQAGEIEAATSRSVALYRDQHTVEDVVIFFLQHSFTIERMVANDAQCNEVNINFRRRAA